MEIDKNMIITLYKCYLTNVDISNALTIYKNKNFCIELLKIKYENLFDFRHIISKRISNDKLYENLFFTHLLNKFIDYINLVNIGPTKDLLNNSPNSYLDSSFLALC